MTISSRFHALGRDARYALHGFRTRPLFAVISILTLALGIGVNSGIYSVLNAVLLRALPVAEPAQLYLPMIGHDIVPYPLFSYPLLQQVSAQLPSPASLAMMTPRTSFNVGVEVASARQQGGQLVSGNYFAVFGTHAALGRLLNPADNQSEGAGPVAVISYEYWSTQFSRSPAVLGSKVFVNNTPVTIIGVAQQGFFGTRVGFSPALWMPLHLQSLIHYTGSYANENGDELKPWTSQDDIRWLQAVVRIGGASTLPQIESRFNSVFKEWVRQHVQTADPIDQQTMLQERIVLAPGRRGFQELQAQLSQPLYLLMGMAGVLLLIACANIANLLLARASARQREIALRLSICATRSSIVRQMLTESLLLAFAGGVVGVAVAWACSHILPTWIGSSTRPLPLNLEPDWRVLGFGTLLCLLTGVLFGLGPALQATRVDPALVLRGSARSVMGGKRSAWSGGKLLVGVQVALSLSLLVAAGLFLRTMRNYSQLDLGFNRTNVLSITMNSHAAGFGSDQVPLLAHKILDATGRLPGVQSASLSSGILEGGSSNTTDIKIMRADIAEPEQLSVEALSITPRYFATLGIPLQRGRTFLETDVTSDAQSAPPVVIVNQEFARRYLDRNNPLGARISGSGSKEAAQIVGVVADARTRDVRERPEPTLYRPTYQSHTDINNLAMRVSGSPHSLEAQIRSALAALNLPASAITTVNEQVDRDLSQQVAVSRLTAFFGLLALALASLGLYGVMAYDVSRRTGEIGVRLALGSPRAAVLRMVLGESLVVILLGVLFGLFLTLSTTRLAVNLLFGLSAHDPLTFLGSALVLLLVGTCASSIPAWRASRVDPMAALRIE